MTSPTWPGLLTTLLAGRHLSAADTGWAMRQIMADNAEPVHVAAFLVALRGKGETAEEIRGLVEAILSEAVPLPVGRDAVDVVGTGGDQAHTVNISTMAAIVVAAAGIPVVKHGGRSVSSKSGAADVLEALGVSLELTPAAVADCVREAGIGFVFAPRFHAGLRHVAPVRRLLGVPTAINYVAPLANPAQPRAALIGCANEQMAPLLAQVLAERGGTALVVRGRDGLDEISTAAVTSAWIADGGTVRQGDIDPLDLGIARSRPDDLRGGDASHNAAAVHDLLAGARGPIRDAVLVNAAAAIAAYRGLTPDLNTAWRAGLATATAAVDSGAARETLARWTSASKNAAARR